MAQDLRNQCHRSPPETNVSQGNLRRSSSFCVAVGKHLAKNKPPVDVSECMHYYSSTEAERRGEEGRERESGVKTGCRKSGRVGGGFGKRHLQVLERCRKSGRLGGRVWETTPSGIGTASFLLSRSFLSLLDDGRWTSCFMRSSPRNPAAVPVSL
ncbi:hypothetical protein BHE74_00039364 [Ensete ventricosum]|nr:hypothetical protein BHE74_00039364 [Ensete ventricosum]RZR95150.1 hypothetical protein BHM03_00023966 [Ensete ventricosum]